jgi:hypothetical protein
VAVEKEERDIGVAKQEGRGSKEGVLWESTREGGEINSC